MPPNHVQRKVDVPHEPILDCEQLLAAIPGENPSGVNLMYAGLHDQIREARRADDVLAQGEWKRDTKTADWPLVIRLCTEALSEKTKDLQVAAWLAEALLNRHGYAGLRDGLRLLRGLIDRYWDTLFPQIDDGDLEARANAVDLLNRPFFLAALQAAPITGNPIGANYSYLQFQDSTRFDIPDNIESLPYEEKERLAALKATATAEAKTTGDQWRTAKSASNRAFYEGLNSLLELCWQEGKSLDDLMDEKFQRQTAGLTDFKKALDAVRTAVASILKEKRILEPDPVDAGEEAEAAGAVAGAPRAGRASGPLGSRAEALRRLGEVAEFFRATEPHSPVSYLLQRTIHWGQISLESWLEEVVKDPGVLANIRETLGLKPPEG